MKWTKSSYSSTGATCVQVRSLRGGVIEIGDTKNLTGPTLTVPHADWEYFLDQIATGGTIFRRLRAVFLPDGGFTLTDTAIPNSPTLTYTKAEWDAFHAGALAGELKGEHLRGVIISA
ncbi:DUF397 domain-containing protein [Nocardiopsis dassonvillei]|uniref:DUF397 domain-containing protein n=1 Tax=Nocardiopsis dassonvillei (strain ATCC 23218 / DSM 43111 / CIP 107115 / JCM 7437 / KCTC 9190 / NBRC 14626 / NCTC 10488 / NRRL B-5397 / IMRU 509) TaxID=446468 RepID=D7AVX3_NOCDD|nr:DUF397 domain-containing protein [Nocardiopsis dassonvillei]ADH69633.1 protein of unknown function DUF397 [Nocardiopsis dassonvillei subsp. dassonvillei DSM 43111]NKY78176.1 DUF397 domain-containing protein [Nocardiopsis dassonvillei]VEI90146.1 Domain of uncharacterised function (DUF397) [Nocardiopsis dassonvillei]